MNETGGNVENPHIDIAAEAVADAMMVAQSKLISAVMDNPDEHFIKGFDSARQLEELLKVGTNSMCEVGSAYAFNFLAQKYPKQFPSMGLLRTFDNYNKPKGKLKDRSSEFHTYFIVKDTKGVWYAGSPSSHTPQETSSALTRIISSADPQDIINKIEELDGGEWPNGQFISQSFKNKDYAPPSFGRGNDDKEIVLNTFRIGNLNGHNTAHMDRVNYGVRNE